MAWRRPRSFSANRYSAIPVSGVPQRALPLVLPLPPFDGSRILRGLLPAGGVRVLDRIEPIGIPLFIIVFIVVPWLMPGLHLVDRLIVPPVSWMLDQYQHLIALVAGPELD